MLIIGNCLVAVKIRWNAYQISLSEESHRNQNKKSILKNQFSFGAKSRQSFSARAFISSTTDTPPYFDCDNIRKSVIIAVILLFARHITLFFTKYSTYQLHIFNSSVHIFVLYFSIFWKKSYFDCNNIRKVIIFAVRIY